jgi:hypothetical protein
MSTKKRRKIQSQVEIMICLCHGDQIRKKNDKVVSKGKTKPPKGRKCVSINIRVKYDH